jgi:hypothetical protein
MMLLLHVLMFLTICSVTASLENLRSTRNDVTATSFQSMNLIRRIYGPENAHVRTNIANLEERMYRYQTGLAPDPTHKVNYENHPYEELHERRLQSNATSVVEGGSRFAPMRIKFFTTALEGLRTSDNSAKIDWYINQILPKTASFWSEALSVVPVSGNLILATSELDSGLYCGDSAFSLVPTAHVTQGVSNADLLLYVSGSNDTRFCPPLTLAVAVPCNFDQFDRPVAGAVNVCLNNIVLQSDGTASASVAKDYLDVSVHEVGHVLGESSNSYRFFWDPTSGKPRTPRPFVTQTVTCLDGVQRSLVLPGNTTLQFTTENGARHTNIVTEKVRAFARNQFDCQSLVGARLESKPTRPESCIGDHWNQRLFYPETMTPVMSPTGNIFSALTLALMEDSGWYKANYTNTHMLPWGLGVGCDFANKPCLIPNSGNGTTTIPDYSRGAFCATENKKGCSPEATTKMACTIMDFSYVVPQTLPETIYQYFPKSPMKGGPLQVDFCPVYGSAYNGKSVDELACTNTANSGAFNLYSEVFGPDSRCFESNMNEGLCYQMACVADMSLRINVRGQWYTWYV